MPMPPAPSCAADPEPKRKCKASNKRLSNSVPNQKNTQRRNHRKHKTYCLCNKASRGSMIACSREGCPVEWFHFKCVGITEAPEGDWFCSSCEKTTLSESEQLTLPEVSAPLNLTLENESVQIVCNTLWNGEYLSQI